VYPLQTDLCGLVQAVGDCVIFQVNPHVKQLMINKNEQPAGSGGVESDNPRIEVSSTSWD